MITTMGACDVCGPPVDAPAHGSPVRLLLVLGGALWRGDAVSEGVNMINTFDGGTSSTNEGRAHRPSKPRYDTRMVARAREHREAGWTHEAIRFLLGEEFGQVPARASVFYWTDEAARARKLVRDRARQRTVTAESPKPRTYSPEYQAAFIRRLRAEGEPVSGIVRVCRVVFGGRWTRGRVQRLLEAK